MNATSRKARRKRINLGLMALEPRWMFDGAAVVDAAHAAPDAAAKALIPDAPAPVQDCGKLEVVFVDTTSSLFKADIGMTVSEWLTDQRLVRAKELVVGSSTPWPRLRPYLGLPTYQISQAHSANVLACHQPACGRVAGNWTEPRTSPTP